MVWDRLGDWLASPLVLIFLVFLGFFGFLWLFVPFALYGLKRRLNRVVELLEDLRDQAGGGPFGPVYRAVRGAGEEGQESSDESLFEEFRRRMREALPDVKEKAWDPANVTFQVQNGGEVVKIAHAALKPGWVEVSFDLFSLGRAFPRFSAEEFRRFVAAFLHERYGYFMASSPDGSHLVVNVNPHPRNDLDLFVGIIQMKVVGKGGVEGAAGAG
ncbi:MAG: hypothetical protein ACE5JJ_02435 [Nitrospinota bacterium]